MTTQNYTTGKNKNKTNTDLLFELILDDGSLRSAALTSQETQILQTYSRKENNKLWGRRQRIRENFYLIEV